MMKKKIIIGVTVMSSVAIIIIALTTTLRSSFVSNESPQIRINDPQPVFEIEEPVLPGPVMAELPVDNVEPVLEAVPEDILDPGDHPGEYDFVKLKVPEPHFTTSSVSYNCPEEINIDSFAKIELLLSLSSDIETLKKRIVEPGTTYGAQIEVSEYIEAILKGTRVKIEPIRPEQQLIQKDKINRWLWRLEPLEEGEAELSLTINNIIEYQNELVSYPDTTYHRVLQVTITGRQKFKNFYQANYQWFIAVIIVPVLGFFAKKWWGFKK